MDIASASSTASPGDRPITYRGLDDMISRGAGLPNNYFYVEKLLLRFGGRAGTGSLMSDFVSTFDAFDSAFIAAVPILDAIYPRARRVMDALRVVVG